MNLEHFLNEFSTIRTFSCVCVCLENYLRGETIISLISIRDKCECVVHKMPIQKNYMNETRNVFEYIKEGPFNNMFLVFDKPL